MQKTILIADDEIKLRRPIVIFLKSKGFIVHEASDGLEALEIVNKNDISLIITDYKMPKMTGLELIKRINELNKKIKIILYTGSIIKETFGESIQLVNIALKKPQKLDTIYGAVMYLINDSEA